MTNDPMLALQRGKYADLIDEETWAYIAKSDASFPTNAVALSYQEQRDYYDAMCEAFRVEYPADVMASDSRINTPTHHIPIRQYQQKGAEPKAQILYFHGGGYLLGSLDSHDDVCAELCAKTGFAVTSVDYRLAPEHIFPAAHDDAVAAYEYLTHHTSLPIILMGDSAGANLAASVAYAGKRRAIKPLGQVLIYPGLTHDFTSQSYIDHAHAPHLATADIEFYRELVTGGIDRSQDPRCVPLADSDFSQLPVTHAFGAGCDPLLDDSRIYSERINAAGGTAYFYNEVGLVHGYLRARHSVKRAGNSFECIVQACQSLIGELCSNSAYINLSTERVDKYVDS